MCTEELSLISHAHRTDCRIVLNLPMQFAQHRSEASAVTNLIHCEPGAVTLVGLG